MKLKLFQKNIFKSYSGFTLMELLVVLGIIGIISGIVVVYGRGSEQQLVLYKEQEKVVGAIQKARNYGLSFTSDPNTPCSYGLHIDYPNNDLIIFKDLSPSSDPSCSDVDNAWSGPNENVEVISMDKFVKLNNSISSGVALHDVVFIPPDPYIMINQATTTYNAEIDIKNIDNSEKIITVNKAGQISVK